MQNKTKTNKNKDPPKNNKKQKHLRSYYTKSNHKRTMNAIP